MSKTPSFVTDEERWDIIRNISTQLQSNENRPVVLVVNPSFMVGQNYLNFLFNKLFLCGIWSPVNQRQAKGRFGRPMPEYETFKCIDEPVMISISSPFYKEAENAIRKVSDEVPKEFTQTRRKEDPKISWISNKFHKKPFDVAHSDLKYLKNAQANDEFVELLNESCNVLKPKEVIIDDDDDDEDQHSGSETDDDDDDEDDKMVVKDKILKDEDDSSDEAEAKTKKKKDEDDSSDEAEAKTKKKKDESSDEEEAKKTKKKKDESSDEEEAKTKKKDESSDEEEAKTKKKKKKHEDCPSTQSNKKQRV